MKVFTYTMLAMVFSLSGCSSQKKLTESAPMDLGDATCQAWSGGRAESGSGILLEIPVLAETSNTIELQKAFFRGMTADITLKTNEGKTMASASFKKQMLERPDIVMHADPKEEVGNKPPKVKEVFPFELGSDECVISYLDGDTVKYFKVTGIKEKKARIYQ
ncbi:hypothetical protein [uncultured Croceitalea sp.]|uniref:hypothetical protein n=1 Tax=uncultured Croceitalea sp. TaxID=1798908 RepID=UPI003305CC9E